MLDSRRAGLDSRPGAFMRIAIGSSTPFAAEVNPAGRHCPDNRTELAMAIDPEGDRRGGFRVTRRRRIFEVSFGRGRVSYNRGVEPRGADRTAGHAGRKISPFRSGAIRHALR
jgi:hypothetical protein